MNLTVTELRENEDGSADVELRMDNEAREFLIQEGFLTILKSYIDSYKPKEKNETT